MGDEEQVEIKEIEQFLEDYFEAEHSKETEAVLEAFTEDVVIQRPNQPEARGKKGVRDYLEGFFKLNITDRGDPKVIEVANSGDLAYVVLHGEIEGDMQLEYKALFAMKKIDGDWKIAAYCWNSNNPQ